MKKGSKILGRVVSFGIMVLSIYLILGVYIMKDEFYIFGYRPVVGLSGSMVALHADKFCGYHPENKRH